MGWGREGNGQKKDRAFPPPPPPHLTFSDASPKGCYLTILTSSFSPPIAPLPLPRNSFFLLLSQFSWRTSRGNACYAGYSANAGVSQQCPPKTKKVLNGAVLSLFLCPGLKAVAKIRWQNVDKYFRKTTTAKITTNTKTKTLPYFLKRTGLPEWLTRRLHGLAQNMGQRSKRAESFTDGNTYSC